MPLILLLILMCWSGTVSAKPAVSPFKATYDAFVETLKQSCAAFENGKLRTQQADPVQYIADFNKDGVTDPIIDEGVFSCSTSATLFSGGTGGRTIHVFVSQPDSNYQRYQFLGGSPMVISVGDTAVLLLSVHAALCDEMGPDACFSAYTWFDSHHVFAAAGGKVALAKHE